MEHERERARGRGLRLLVTAHLSAGHNVHHRDQLEQSQREAIQDRDAEEHARGLCGLDRRV